jgi:plasmid stabilization system protein ParE
MYLEYSTRALIDMDDQAAFIQVQSPRSALRFMDAVEATSELLLRFPEFGSLVESDDPEINGLRVCQVRY